MSEADLLSTPILLAAAILVPLLGAAFTVTVPAAERRLVRVVCGVVGLMGAGAVWLGMGRASSSEALHWDTGWQPVQMFAASVDGQDALTLVLRPWSIPLMLGTFGALVALAISAGVRPSRSGSDGAAVSAVFGRVLATAGLTMVVYLADDLLVMALAWLGLRLASALALRVDVAPQARSQVDDRAAVAFAVGLALVGAVLVGAMAAYNVSDGVFSTHREVLETILLPVDRQYVVAAVLALAALTSLGIVPFHRGWRAGFDHAPSTAATAFAIELGATLHVLWFMGTTLAPVAMGELADTTVVVCLAAAAWQMLVARNRGTPESALLALASLASALCIFGLSLGRTAGLASASLLGGTAQVALVVAAAGVQRDRGQVDEPPRPWLSIVGALAVLGLFPAAGHAGVVSLWSGALEGQTSQMRWPQLFIVIATVLAALCVVSIVRSALLTALDHGAGAARSPGGGSKQARDRVMGWGLMAVLCVGGLMAGPLVAAVVADAHGLDGERAQARCFGVSGRELRNAVARDRLPVDCSDAHASLRRAYGLDASEEGGQP